LPAVIAAAAAVVAASLLIGALRHHPIVISGGTDKAVGPEVAEAAVWHTDAFAVGASGPLSKKESNRFVAQKDRVRATVRDLADAFAIAPEKLPDVATRVMTASAAASVVKRAQAMPEGAEQVTVLRRVGRIGIQAPHFAAAAADIKVVMQATIDGRVVKWSNKLTFWLQRDNGEWRVIAFDLDRSQLS
jgi:hypothetical protein